jgi:hypothetical protein
LCDYRRRPVRSNIKKRFKSEYPEETKEAYLVENLFSEFENGYVHAVKRTIVDYVLMVR